MNEYAIALCVLDVDYSNSIQLVEAESPLEAVRELAIELFDDDDCTKLIKAASEQEIADMLFNDGYSISRPVEL